MLGWFKTKPKIGLDLAVKKFLEHSAHEGQELGAAFAAALANYSNELEIKADVSAILARPLLTFQGGGFAPGQRTLFAGHCYALALVKGLEALYKSPLLPWQARAVDFRVAKLVTEEDVGPENVGHAPSPRPEPGVHITYAPDALVGGVASQQMTLIQKYRRLAGAPERLSMFCLALGVVPIGHGVGIAVLEEVPGSRRGDTASFNLGGYRHPNADEVDEWSDDLEILDADAVLTGLSPSIYHAMLKAAGRVDPFWPSFCDSHRIT